MKKTIIFLLYLSLFSVIALAQPKTITLKGHVQFDDPKLKMQVFRYEGQGMDQKKIVLGEFETDKDNNFKFDIKVEEPGICFLDCKSWEKINFWAEDENIEVNFRGQDTAKVKDKIAPFHMIKGGPKNDLINHINYSSYRQNQTSAAITMICSNAGFTNDKDKAVLNSTLAKSLQDDQFARMRMLAELYFDRNSVISILNYLKADSDKELLEKILSSFNTRYPAGYVPLQKYIKAKEIAAANVKRAAIGSVAPDFEFPTIDGKLIGPKNFRGKVLVIDFWASWCGPCRAEFPNLRAAYEKYKDKGVEFLSVSIDKNPEEWKKAIGLEKLPWPQVLSPKAGKDLMTLYQFSMIPFIIIIDSDGIIYGKNLRGEKLALGLEELTNRKK
ncbi:MAG: TlpA disulfide reductase family protein [Bacteroidales bacterium]|jgi:thiol-disulfide isomerase/thioredoxin